jgi:glycosyltransferase involved in cell wall biosynthesis
MAETIRVCHVVNSAGDTSMPCDLATTQATFADIEQVGVLGWFGVDEFSYMDRVDVVSLDAPNTFRLPRSAYVAAKAVLSEYDLVHTHHPHSGLYGKLIAKRLGKPVVQTEHNNHRGYTREGRIVNGVSNVLADAVICVSESVKESFPRWERAITKNQKVSVIDNGVDTERLDASTEIPWSIHDIAQIASDAIVVGSAGLLTEQKAHDVLIDAVDRANAESQRPIELVISGDGALREPLDAQIKDAEYSDRLHLLGFLEKREQVYEMMREVDIYAMPSRWEGFCVAALEAMAVGNPCVFSDIDEFVRPFSEVALFHPVDDAETLAERLLELAADKKKRYRYQQAALDLVHQRYTLRRTAERYLQTYCDCLASD